MDIQRLRNLTTGRLRVMRSVEPWLRQHVTDAEFWDDKYDPSHVGEYPLPQPTAEDRKAMMKRYFAQPNPLDSKNVITATI